MIEIRVHMARFEFGSNVGHPGVVLSLVVSDSANYQEGMQLDLSPIRNEPNKKWTQSEMSHVYLKSLSGVSSKVHPLQLYASPESGRVKTNAVGTSKLAACHRSPEAAVL